MTLWCRFWASECWKFWRSAHKSRVLVAKKSKILAKNSIWHKRPNMFEKSPKLKNFEIFLEVVKVQKWTDEGNLTLEFDIDSSKCLKTLFWKFFEESKKFRNFQLFNHHWTPMCFEKKFKNFGFWGEKITKSLKKVG